MPSSLALLLSFGFIAFLFYRDHRERPAVTRALWIPVTWFLIIGSRPISEWLNWGPPLEGSALEEGSPLDRLVFLALIVAGFFVLRRRQVRLSQVVRENAWLTLYLLYCLFSIVWSDFPLVAFKRWTKILGHPIMVLIVLTEPDPMQGVTTLMKRCAYVLITLSVAFVKYFPALGRGYSEWTGQAFYTGVTTNKNALGYLCMVFGFFFVWLLLKTLRAGRTPNRRKQLILCIGFLALILWLLALTDAKTALVTFLFSALTAVLLGTRLIVKRYIGVYLVAAVVLALSAELFFGVYTKTITLLGRDPTLTDRTEVWKDVLEMDKDPVLGTGFESFWLGERLDKMWAKYWWRPNQAHNGYIETYLNLGFVGVGLLLALIIATFRKIRRELLRDLDWGRFRFCLLFAILLFNYTDAIFKALHPLWFIFYLVAVDYSGVRSAATAGVTPSDRRERSRVVVSAPSAA
jgi:exopolysaccharide production protein ExoQ